MRTYKELNPQEQEQAQSRCLELVLREVTYDPHVVDDELAKKVELAYERAESMQTPWFAGEYIMDTCEVELKALALEHAQQALYPSRGEFVVYL